MTTVEPVTPDRWDDLRSLFGDRGAYANCWCTWWRLPAARWSEMTPAEREQLLRGLVEDGSEPGLLAYRDGVPVGWVAVSPRTDLPRLNRSPHLKAVDDRPVWSISCFWVAPGHRSSGVATALLDGAVAHARRRGAAAVEGYPVDPATRRTSASDAFTGSIELFRRAGFEEVARRAPTARVVMRRALTAAGASPPR